MGFLDKLKLTKKDSGVVPPPPPAPADKEGKPSLPPLPTAKKASSDDSMTPPPMPDAPSGNVPKGKEVSESSAPAQKPSMPKPPKPAPAPAPAAPQPKPPQPNPAPAPQPKQAPMPPAPEAEKSAPTHVPKAAPRRASREDVRKHFGDMPPIKVEADGQGTITDAHAESFDVSKFKLPDEDNHRDEMPFKSSPQAQPQSASHTQQEQHSTPQAQPQTMPHTHQSPKAPEPETPFAQPHLSAEKFTGPLYVNVDTYEQMQKTIGSLKKELIEVTSSVEAVVSIKEKEDEEFVEIVKRLEQVQEGILKVDEELFEQ